MVNVTVHILRKSNLGRTPPDFQFFLLLSKRNCVTSNCTFHTVSVTQSQIYYKNFWSQTICYVIKVSQFVIVQLWAKTKHFHKSINLKSSLHKSRITNLSRNCQQKATEYIFYLFFIKKRLCHKNTREQVPSWKLLFTVCSG